MNGKYLWKSRKVYDRIFQVIYTIVSNAKGDTSKSCLYYAYVGSNILKKYYKISAKPVAGAAAYYICDKDTVLAFGEKNDEILESSIDKFHCWVEVNNFVIDFMAPVIGASFGVKIQPNMCIKLKGELITTLNDMKIKGKFLIKPNDDLTKHYFSENIPLLAKDLSEIAIKWFEKPPKPLAINSMMLDNHGNICNLEIKGPNTIGSSTNHVDFSKFCIGAASR
jgi:hypothetical protein